MLVDPQRLAALELHGGVDIAHLVLPPKENLDFAQRVGIEATHPRVFERYVHRHVAVVATLTHIFRDARHVVVEVLEHIAGK